MISIPKGTKDILPRDVARWQGVENAARAVADVFGMREIRTPIFEHTELFLRGVGEGTDIVNKEMYTFVDKGGKSITLKPEGTASLVRSYIENSLDGDGLPVKLFYLTPVFRYERPQAGRLRQHHQFGAEIYGAYEPYADFEIIHTVHSFFARLGLDGIQLNINSLGCASCRQKYIAALCEFLQHTKDALCGDCKTRIEKNPLRTLDCKVDLCKNALKNAPIIADFACEDCKEHFSRLCALLDQAKIPYQINSRIVRGLDYYTKTVFEFIDTPTNLTVCGGGRYDNLIESLGGKPTGAVGFGMGIERVLMLLEKSGLSIGENFAPSVFVAAVSKAEADFVALLVARLRNKGISAEFDPLCRSLKAQARHASRLNARYLAVVGGDEIASNCIKLKRLSDGAITDASLDRIEDFI